MSTQAVWIVTGVRGGVGATSAAALLASTLRSEGVDVKAYAADATGDFRRLAGDGIDVVEVDLREGATWSQVLDGAAKHQGQTVLSLQGSTVGQMPALSVFTEDAISVGLDVRLAVVVDPACEAAFPTLEMLRVPIVLLCPLRLGPESAYRHFQALADTTDGYHLLFLPELSAPAMAMLRACGVGLDAITDANGPIYLKSAASRWADDSRRRFLAGTEGV